VYLDCSDRVTYLFVAGTSMSAPHVAGQAAVLEAQFPGNQTPAELAACIHQTADPLPNPGRTGHGRINVLRALKECNL
jgi:subtilisin family serine protease